MDRTQKADAIVALKDVFAGAGAVVVTHYMGLTVAEMTELRNRLRKEGATLKVVKNTLVQKALDGVAGDAGNALFTGPVAIAYGADPVSAAKIVVQYAKENDKYSIIGGLLGLSALLSGDRISLSVCLLLVLAGQMLLLPCLVMAALRLRDGLKEPT
jgi:large subunit ribosomal protein L10